MSFSHVPQYTPYIPQENGKKQKQRIEPGFKFPPLYYNIKNIYIYNSHKGESERSHRPCMLNPVLSLTFQKRWGKRDIPHFSDVTIRKYSGEYVGKTSPVRKGSDKFHVTE